MKQPNSQILHSTKGCQLALATLPEEARESHILQGLAHSSLISFRKSFDHGCEANFNQNNSTITKYKQVLLQNTRNVITSLWIVPLQILDRPTNQSNHVYQVNGKENSIKYLHAAEFITVQNT